jgi:hypothetical protein
MSDLGLPAFHPLSGGGWSLHPSPSNGRSPAARKPDMKTVIELGVWGGATFAILLMLFVRSEIARFRSWTD